MKRDDRSDLAAPFMPALPGASAAPSALTHLQRLEAESIHIMREVVAECEKPVMLYSIGKDSACMLHLARKAFFPSPPPFPLLHVDTTWKFKAMYALRDRMVRESEMELLVYQNPQAAKLGLNPFTHGSQLHTDMWKTQGLKQALDQYGFDAAFGGARRDEEKSRAKERIFSFRSAQHRWDPKSQRPELWRLYNARKHPGESLRVFPLSNWTELDVWQYIAQQRIPIVPLYLAMPAVLHALRLDVGHGILAEGLRRVFAENVRHGCFQYLRALLKNGVQRATDVIWVWRVRHLQHHQRQHAFAGFLLRCIGRPLRRGLT